MDVRLGSEAIEQLVEDYRSGMSSSRLQVRYDLSKGTVLRLLEESGVDMRRQGLTAEQRVEVVRLYNSRLTIREVAAALEVPKTTVQDALRLEGVAMRKAARRRR